MLVLPFLYQRPGEAQCASSNYSPGTVWSPDYVWLNSAASMQNSGDAFAASTAAGYWKSACGSYGQSMGTSIPTTSRPFSGSYGVVTINYVAGYNTANPTYCADFSGTPGGFSTTINVYQYANSPSGAQFTCGAAAGGYGQIIAHELGHYYGLNNSDCATSVMSNVNNQAHYVQGEECQLANQTDHVNVEINPSYCNEPCAQSCSQLGNCPAFQESPIVLNVKGGEIRLTGPEVFFDIQNTGVPQLMGWTEADHETAFLVLDRNGNGTIDNGSELFGNKTILPDGSGADNGFLALGWYDRPENGGNSDGIIDRRDAVYGRLRLWFDDNHDGVSQPSELRTLAEMGIELISLNYKLSRKTDLFGNNLLYRASARITRPNGASREIVVYDVYFRTE